MTHDYVFYIKQLQDYWSHKIMTIEYFAVHPFNTSVTPPDATTGLPVDEHPCIKKQWPASHDLDGQIFAGSAPILDIKAIDFNIVHIVVIRVFETINLSSVNCSSKPSPLFFIHRYLLGTNIGALAERKIGPTLSSVGRNRRTKFSEKVNFSR